MDMERPRMVQGLSLGERGCLLPSHLRGRRIAAVHPKEARIAVPFTGGPAQEAQKHRVCNERRAGVHHTKPQGRSFHRVVTGGP